MSWVNEKQEMEKREVELGAGIARRHAKEMKKQHVYDLGSGSPGCPSFVLNHRLRNPSKFEAQNGVPWTALSSSIARYGLHPLRVKLVWVGVT